MPASAQNKPAKRESLLGRLKRLVPLWSQLNSLRVEQRKLRDSIKAFQKKQWAEQRQLHRDFNHTMQRVEESLSRIDDRVTEMERQLRLARRQRWKTFEKLDALLRRDYLAEFLADDLAVQIDGRRFNLLSQNEEDGMILALLQAAGIETRTFVELGSGQSGGNSGMLADELGWRGIMVELDSKRAEKCAQRFGRSGRVHCLCAEVSPDNINQLIVDHGLGGEVDFFSLDIDSFDYWVLDAMTACQPRVMVLEYNANYGPEAAVTVPLGAPLADGPKGYHGASLAAMTKLAERKGYRLLACDRSGTNAFYLRNDLCRETLSVPVAQAFRPKMMKSHPSSEPRPDDVDIIVLAGEMKLPLEYV